MAEDGKKDGVKVGLFEVQTPNGGTIKFNEEGAISLLQAYQMYVQITHDYFPKAHESVLREMEDQAEDNPDFTQSYKFFRLFLNSELEED